MFVGLYVCGIGCGMGGGGGGGSCVFWGVEGLVGLGFGIRELSV